MHNFYSVLLKKKNLKKKKGDLDCDVFILIKKYKSNKQDWQVQTHSKDVMHVVW